MRKFNAQITVRKYCEDYSKLACYSVEGTIERYDQGQRGLWMDYSTETFIGLFGHYWLPLFHLREMHSIAKEIKGTILIRIGDE